MVGIFAFTRWVGWKNCLSLLETQQAILAGAQGLSLLWQNCRDQLSADRNYYSFGDPHHGGWDRVAKLRSEGGEWSWNCTGWGGAYDTSSSVIAYYPRGAFSHERFWAVGS